MYTSPHRRADALKARVVHEPWSEDGTPRIVGYEGDWPIYDIKMPKIEPRPIDNDPNVVTCLRAIRSDPHDGDYSPRFQLYNRAHPDGFVPSGVAARRRKHSAWSSEYSNRPDCVAVEERTIVTLEQFATLFNALQHDREACLHTGRFMPHHTKEGYVREGGRWFIGQTQWFHLKIARLDVKAVSPSFSLASLRTKVGLATFAKTLVDRVLADCDWIQDTSFIARLAPAHGFSPGAHLSLTFRLSQPYATLASCGAHRVNAAINEAARAHGIDDLVDWLLYTLSRLLLTADPIATCRILEGTRGGRVHVLEPRPRPKAVVVNRGRSELCLPQSLTQPLGPLSKDEFYRAVIDRRRAQLTTAVARPLR